jgi:hypothetical protein
MSEPVSMQAQVPVPKNLDTYDTYGTCGIVIHSVKRNSLRYQPFLSSMDAVRSDMDTPPQR